MNILFVAQSFDKGGRTKRIVDLATCLLQRGYNVLLCAFEEPPDWIKAKYPILDHAITLNKMSGGRFSITRQLIRALRQHQIEIIHAHCETSFFHAGLSSLFTHKPVIGTYHRSNMKYYRPRFKYRFYARLLTHCIAISQDRMTLMLNNLNIPPAKISLIHGGVNFDNLNTPSTQESAKQALNLDKKTLVLLSLGHLGKIKGHEYSIKAMPRLVRQFPSAQLFIGGQGSSEDTSRLTQLINNLEMEAHITLLGEISNPFDWLTACDLFVQAPLDEGFGLVFIEAGACKKAVVASAVGGIKDIIVHGETGLLVPPCDTLALTAAIKQLLENPAQAKTMGEKGYQRVEEFFTLNHMTDQYIKVYQQLK